MNLNGNFRGLKKEIKRGNKIERREVDNGTTLYYFANISYILNSSSNTCDAKSIEASGIFSDKDAMRNMKYLMVIKPIDENKFKRPVDINDEVKIIEYNTRTKYSDGVHRIGDILDKIDTILEKYDIAGINIDFRHSTDNNTVYRYTEEQDLNNFANAVNSIDYNTLLGQLNTIDAVTYSYIASIDEINDMISRNKVLGLDVFIMGTNAVGIFNETNNDLQVYLLNRSDCNIDNHTSALFLSKMAHEQTSYTFLDLATDFIIRTEILTKRDNIAGQLELIDCDVSVGLGTKSRYSGLNFTRCKIHGVKERGPAIICPYTHNDTYITDCDFSDVDTMASLMYMAHVNKVEIKISGDIKAGSRTLGNVYDQISNNEYSYLNLICNSKINEVLGLGSLITNKTESLGLAFKSEIGTLDLSGADMSNVKKLTVSVGSKIDEIKLNGAKLPSGRLNISSAYEKCVGIVTEEKLKIIENAKIENACCAFEGCVIENVDFSKYDFTPIVEKLKSYSDELIKQCNMSIYTYKETVDQLYKDDTDYYESRGTINSLITPLYGMFRNCTLSNCIIGGSLKEAIDLMEQRLNIDAEMFIFKNAEIK